MTKKDYECIARAIKSIDAASQDEDDTICRVAVAIACALEADNPNFQYAKFLAAAGFH